MSNIHVRINDTQKKSAQQVLKKLGLDLSSAIKLFLQQIIVQERIPFDITTHNVPRGTSVETLVPGSDYIGLGCGAVIFNQQGEILLMRRTAKTRNDHGKWSIPGGKVEFGETVEYTIARELEEECDIIVQNPKSIGYVDHFVEGDGHHWVSIIFVVREFTGIPKNMEPEKCDKIGWFSLEQIPKNSSDVVFNAVKLLKSSTWNNL